MLDFSLFFKCNGGLLSQCDFNESSVNKGKEEVKHNAIDLILHFVGEMRVFLKNLASNVCPIDLEPSDDIKIEEKTGIEPFHAKPFNTIVL